MPDNNPGPQSPPSQTFRERWTAYFGTNTFEDIDEVDFQRFAQEIDDTFIKKDELTTNQVRGATFRTPYVVIASGQPTIDTNRIPARFRIVGMEALATNGTDQASASAGAVADPILFRLIRHSTGLIDALVDEKPTTTLTVKAHWVRLSGTEAQKAATYPVLILEDQPYLAGDVFQYTFQNLQPPVTRLFEWRANSTGFTHPLPTGLDSDPIYKPYAPLQAEDNTGLVTDLTERLVVLEQAITPSVQAALGGYSYPPDIDNPLTTAADLYVDLRSEIEVRNGATAVLDTLSLVLQDDTTLTLPVRKVRHGVVCSVRVLPTATSPLLVTIAAGGGTLDGGTAAFWMQPGEWRLIRKPPSNNATGAYVTAHHGGQLPAVPVALFGKDLVLRATAGGLLSWAEGTSGPPQPAAPTNLVVDANRRASFTLASGTVASDYEFEIS